MKTTILFTLIGGVVVLTGAVPSQPSQASPYHYSLPLNLDWRPRPRLFMCAPNMDIR